MYALIGALIAGVVLGVKEYFRRYNEHRVPYFSLGTPKFDPEEAKRLERENKFG